MFKNNLTIFSLFSEITYAFKPDAIVVQCGADCLSNDPLGIFSNFDVSCNNFWLQAFQANISSQSRVLRNLTGKATCRVDEASEGVIECHPELHHIIATLRLDV